MPMHVDGDGNRGKWRVLFYCSSASLVQAYLNLIFEATVTGLVEPICNPDHAVYANFP